MFELLSRAVLSGLLTYLLHSSLLITMAAGAGRLLGSRRVALQEALWKAALLGGLATASLSGAGGFTPLGGHWMLPRAERAAAAPALRIDLTAPARSQRPPEVAIVPPGETAPLRQARPLSWPARLTLAWLAGVALGLGALAASFASLRRRLCDRRPLADADLARFVERLSRAAGLRQPVTLTESRAVAVPVALGLRRPEICLPAWTREVLEPAQVKGILTHELAHHARRDPAWLLLAHLVQRVFFIQPFNGLVRRRLQELSDVRADDWTVRQTGAATSLASCLGAVAERVAAPRESAFAVAGVGGASALRSRVQRLVQGESETPSTRAGARALLGAWALLVGVAIAAPGIRAQEPAAPDPPEIPELVEEAEGPAPPEEAALSEAPAAPEAKAAPEAPSPDDRARLQQELDRALEQVRRLSEKLAASKETAEGLATSAREKAERQSLRVLERKRVEEKQVEEKRHRVQEAEMRRLKADALARLAEEKRAHRDDEELMVQAALLKELAGEQQARWEERLRMLEERLDELTRQIERLTKK